MAAALAEAVKATLAQMKTVPVATASAAGVPNVVPVEFVRAIDDGTIVIADNYQQLHVSALCRNAMKKGPHGASSACHRRSDQGGPSDVVRWFGPVTSSLSSSSATTRSTRHWTERNLSGSLLMRLNKA